MTSAILIILSRLAPLATSPSSSEILEILVPAAAVIAAGLVVFNHPTVSSEKIKNKHIIVIGVSNVGSVIALNRIYNCADYLVLGK